MRNAVKAGATKETLASQVKQDDLFTPNLKAPWAFNANFFGQLFDALKSNPNGEPRTGELMSTSLAGVKVRRPPAVCARHLFWHSCSNSVSTRAGC